LTETNPFDAPPPPNRATFDDWCHLHRITQKQCIGWLGDLPLPECTKASHETLALDSAQVWRWCADAMAATLPEHRDVIYAALKKADINTSPDIVKFPHAFTLHNTGNGRPYVSVPYTGSARDILTLAHEFGHVLQILNTKAPDTPPVLREVCAFLAEVRLLEHLASFNTELRDKIQNPWARSVAVDFGARRTALLAACAAPQTPYDYAWNYPLARRLALEAVNTLDAPDHWLLFTGSLDVVSLAGRVGI
jgi:hypothetical protein